jgi:hypothetical protein
VHIPIVSLEDARYELLQLGAEDIVESPSELRDATGETVRNWMRSPRVGDTATPLGPTYQK